MQDLSDLIQSLNSNEQKSVRQMLVLKSEHKYGKRIQLFDLLISKPEIDNTDASQYIYKAKPNSALSQLKRRLKGDLLEMLLVCGEDHDDQYRQNEQECARMLMQSQQLINKGLNKMASKLLDQVAQISRKYEFWEFSNLAAKYKAYSMETVESILTKYSGETKNSNLDLEQILNNLEEHLINSKSKRRDLLLILQYLEQKLSTDFSVIPAFEIKRIVEVIKKIPALSKSTYVRASHQLMAKAMIIQGNYLEALEYLKPRFNNLEITTRHMLIETLFIAKLKLKQYDEAQNLLVKWDYEDKNSQSLSKIKYYSACMKFQVEDHKSVIKNLNASNKYKKQQNEFLAFWSRILELMSLSELKEYDWAEYRLDALRKYFNNHNLHKKVQCRNALRSLRHYFLLVQQNIYCDTWNTQNYRETYANNYHPDVFNFEIIDWNHWVKTRVTLLISNRKTSKDFN
ncbi:MAG: hypothetical protein KAI29_03715 [Cyclobacteriaceae bacterium]|nr:hypothetical protein [Cyclobacteriaceae bacterium]